MHFMAAMAVSATLLMSSCTTSQSALNDLRSFQQEIDINGSTYTISDWKDAAQKYAKLNKKIYKHYNEYTPQELEEVGRINGQCAASFARGTATNVAGKAQGALGIIRGIIDGVSSSFPGLLKK